MMNRQLRRAQEKKDRQKEREKARAKAARRAKVMSRRTQRREKTRKTSENASERASDKAKASDQAREARKRRAGRFSGAFTIATAVFIVLQALVPVTTERSAFALVIEVLYYLLFGYFAATWLTRRGQSRSFGYAAIAGVVLALLLQLARQLSGLGVDVMLLAAALPAAVAGAWLGRFVYLRAP